MTHVLFVCVHNAGRSQMAEALFNRRAFELDIDARAESAGTLGGGRINPFAASAMAEIGIPLEGHFAKALTQEMVDRADMVVSMGCGVDASSCPARFLLAEDWGLDDPAGQPLEKVHIIRDQIRAKVEALLARLEAD